MNPPVSSRPFPPRLRHMARMVLAASWLLSSACGGAIQTADRAQTPAEVTAAYLVGVTDSRPTRAYRRVSVSLAKVDMTGQAPDKADASVVESMKQAAAARGAKMLWIERSVNRWQRRFYGWGLVWAEAPTAVQTCGHSAFTPALAEAAKAAEKCFRELKKQRPGLSGAVEILFEVDAWGGIRNAAPSPNSSRDTQVHSCAMLAVYRQNYGAPQDLSCRATLKAALP